MTTKKSFDGANAAGAQGGETGSRSANGKRGALEVRVFT
jgi:hypothetical protein